MNADYRKRLVSYRMTMSLVSEMLSDGLISEKEYARIDRIIASSRGLDLSGICCRNPLIYKEFRGNMTPAIEGGETDETNDKTGQLPDAMPH